jgi:hypothetical protein
MAIMTNNASDRTKTRNTYITRILYTSFCFYVAAVLFLLVLGKRQSASAEVLSKWILRLLGELRHLGINYRGGYIYGVLPSYLYDALVGISVMWAIFTALLYGVQFVLEYDFLRVPTLYAIRLQERNQCSLYEKKAVIARGGGLVFWGISFLFFIDGLTGSFAFHVSDDLATFVWVLLVGCSGGMLLWMPLALLSMAVFDVKTIFNYLKRLIKGQ